MYQQYGGSRGNNFLRMLEPIAARMPYMTTTGNHEKAKNFSHYDARFSMIGDRHQPNYSADLTDRLNNHFYSLDIGPAHIIIFSTEFYYYTRWGWEQIRWQYRWLEDELIRANQNRKERPWIIVMGHRPFYCLVAGDKCNRKTLERGPIKNGVHYDKTKKSQLNYGLEDLFYKYGVDLQLYGHEHFFVRFYPVHKNVSPSRPKEANPYEDPVAPVFITTGNAVRYFIYYIQPTNSL